MLYLTIPARENWDESQSKFIQSKSCTLQLEHSLISLSKWESKWCKPFLTKEEKTMDETVDYVRCMTLTQNVSNEVYANLTDENFREIHKYIEAPMTATTFPHKQNHKPNREIVTAELIYHWMIALNIPFECQKWHLNRLLTLVRVCDIKNQPPKKRGKKAMMSERAALNKSRQKSLGTKG